MIRSLRLLLLAVVCWNSWTSDSAADEPRPSKITIREEKISLTDSLKLLEDQSKVRLLNSIVDQKDPELSLDIKEATFWQALDRIASLAGARVELYRPDGQIELYRRGVPSRLPVSYSGLFRVSLRKLSTFHDYANATNGTSLTMEVAWEPAFEPFSLETRPRKWVFKDDQGRDAIVPSSGSLWTAVDKKRAVYFDVTLPPLPRKSGKIGLLKGELPIRGPSRMHAFRWKQDGKELTFKGLESTKLPLTQQAGEKGTTCSVNKVRIGAKSWSVQVEVQLPSGGPDFESFQTWFVHNEIYLVHADGKRRLVPGNPTQDNAGVTKAVLTYRFEVSNRDKPEEWFLVCRVPASMIELTIPFEFKDVPLP